MILIVILLIFAAIGLAYYLDNIKQKRPKLAKFDDNIKLSKIIGGKKLLIAQSWFRFSQLTSDEFVEKVELVFLFNFDDAQSKKPIYVTIQPKRKALASAKLLDTVYLRQFSTDENKVIKGLIGKPLKPITGYKGETVFYDPISANPFVAKCIDPVIKNESKKCIRTVDISNNLSATYSFDFDILNYWRQFDEQAKLWLSKIDGL